MFEYSKHVKMGLVFMFIGALLTKISVKDLLANLNFSPEKHKFSGTSDCSPVMGKRIRAGTISSADMIVDYHPRLLLRGEADWDKNIEGSFAWRIMHDPDASWYNMNCDSEIGELINIIYNVDACFGYIESSHTYVMRPHWAFVVGKGLKLGWQIQNASYEPQHTVDEYLVEARSRLFSLIDYVSPPSIGEDLTVFLRYGTVVYDWMLNETFIDGTPILSEKEKENIRNAIIAAADYLKSRADSPKELFNSSEITDYDYVMAGLALYEPSLEGDPDYAAINAKAKNYLEDFDRYYVGKILPALNAQGADGGWHGGLYSVGSRAWYSQVLQVSIAHILFAHMTATNQKIGEHLYSTEAIKNLVKFQAYMIAPRRRDHYNSWVYLPLGPNAYEESRYAWIGPLMTHSRRRFSNDLEQQKLAKLGGWILRDRQRYANEGSFDMMDQLMFEEKWPYPSLSPSEIGYPPTNHFSDLGWVIMRSGFDSEDDLAAAFICQRYHWSNLNEYSQNSFYLECKGDLIEGTQNSIWIDDEYQRVITEDYPTIDQGIEAYSPGSVYDVGPGIQAFESTDKYDYMFGDATNAYDKNKLEKFTRGLVWIKVNNCFIIFDRVITKDAGVKKSWVIEPGAKPKTEGDRLVKISNGSGALWVKRLIPEQTTETMSGGRFEVVSNQSVKEDYFLHVMQAVDANLSKDSPKVVADEAQLIINDDQIGINVDGWKVLFDKTGSAEISVDYTNVKYKSKSELDYRLFQNYPNPFNASTGIIYSLPEKGHVKLEIYNVLGKRIKTLVNTIQDAEMKSVNWNGLDENGKNVTSGVYLCRLEVDDFVSVKKMMFLR